MESKSSSSSAFLQVVQPRIALISSGYRNRYQYSHQVLQRLEALGIAYFITANGGELWLSFPNKIEVPLQVI